MVCTGNGIDIYLFKKNVFLYSSSYSHWAHDVVDVDSTLQQRHVRNELYVFHPAHEKFTSAFHWCRPTVV